MGKGKGEGEGEGKRKVGARVLCGVNVQQEEGERYDMILLFGYGGGMSLLTLHQPSTLHTSQANNTMHEFN